MTAHQGDISLAPYFRIKNKTKQKTSQKTKKKNQPNKNEPLTFKFLSFCKPNKVVDDCGYCHLFSIIRVQDKIMPVAIGIHNQPGMR